MSRIYKVPGQNLEYKIPEDGEVFSDGYGGVYKWEGNRVLSLSAQYSGGSFRDAQGKSVSLGFDVNSLPQYNPGDVAQAVTKMGGRYNNQAPFHPVTDFAVFQPKPVASTGETFTQGVSATNPNAHTLTSSKTGEFASNAPKYGDPNAINPGSLSTLTNPNAGFNQTGGSTAGFNQTVTQPAPYSQTDPNRVINTTTGQTAGQMNAPVTPAAPVDTNYFMKAGESTEAYNARVLAYNQSKNPAPEAPPVGGSITADKLAGSNNPQFNSSQFDPYDASKLPSDVAEPELSSAETDVQSRIDKIMKQQEEAAGRGAYQLEQENQRNIPELRKLQNDFSSQLKLAQLEAANIQQATQTGQGVTSAIDARQRAEALRKNSVKSLGIYAMLEMAKGNLATAQDAADRATEQKYGPIEAQIEAAISNVNLIMKSPEYTAAEKARAARTEAALQANKAAIDAQKAEAADIWDLTFKAMENGLTDPTILNRIRNAGSKEEAAQIAAPYIKKEEEQWSAPYNLGGDLVQKSSTTGQIRTAVNVSSGGGGSGPVTITAEDKRGLVGAGFTSTEANAIGADVNKYGLAKVLEGITDPTQKAAIQKVYGVDASKETKLTRASMSALFGIADNSSKSGILGFFGGGKTNSQKLDDLMSTIKKYQDVGYKDDEILKLMQEKK